MYLSGRRFRGHCLNKTVRDLATTATLLLLPVTSHAEWQAIEKTQTYAVSGTSGPDLYASIGARGPRIGKARVIAHTSFKLTWTRKYEPQPDGACTLVTAKPKLIITYMLPKPSRKLPPAIHRNWQTFIAGVASHERVHGDYIKDMVREIETLSIGFSASDDPGCTRVRAELTKRLAEISRAQRQRSVDFDRVELTDGGNIHQLILNLVNGG